MTDVDAEEEAETPERLAAAVDVAMRAPNLAQIMDELELLLGPFQTFPGTFLQAQIMDELELTDYNDYLHNQAGGRTP